MEGEERRTAPDGGYYTYQEFYDFYGSEDEWYAAAAPAEKWDANAARAANDAAAHAFDTNEGHEQHQATSHHPEDSDDSNDPAEPDDPTHAVGTDDVPTAPQEGYYDEDGAWIEPDYSPDNDTNINPTTVNSDSEEDSDAENNATTTAKDDDDEEEEAIDWFDELEEEDQEDLTEWLEEFLDKVEIYTVVDAIIYTIENYNPERDPVFLDAQSELGFRTKQSISYVQKFALGTFYKHANGQKWDRQRGWKHVSNTLSLCNTMYYQLMYGAHY